MLITKYSGEQKIHAHMQNKVLTNIMTHSGAVFSYTHTVHSYPIIIFFPKGLHIHHIQTSLVCLVQPF